MTVWYTSDTHFYHENIIKYCGRPFKDVNQMNEIIIRNWNERIQPNDLVYHLGDFGLFSKGREPQDILNRLNGNIHLIKGNHDSKITEIAFEERYERDNPTGFKLGGHGVHTCREREMVINDTIYSAIMVHKPSSTLYALEELWSGDNEPIILYGHVHEKAPKHLHYLDFGRKGKYLAYHVGVDTNDFIPVTQQLIEYEIKNFDSYTDYFASPGKEVPSIKIDC